MITALVMLTLGQVTNWCGPGKSCVVRNVSIPLGQTYWFNSPTNTLGLRGVGSTITTVGGGFSTTSSMTFASGANVNFTGGTADASSIISSTNTGGNIFLQSAIGAAAATTSVAAFHIRHTNGALASTDLEFLSEDSTGNDLVKWDETGLATIRTGVALGTTLLTWSATAPTISSGFGTSPTVTGGNTAAFRINVGTGGTASSGVIGLPTASTAWNCSCVDITTPATSAVIKQSGAGTTTTCPITNYVAGVATAWAASDILACMCAAY